MAPESGLSRRGLLGGGALALGAGLAGAGLGWGAGSATASSDAVAIGGERVPFFGPHQAGITTDPQSFATFVGLDLRAGSDRESLTRILRLWTEDAGRLTQGRPALADREPELADAPWRLTVTVGLGPGAFVGLADKRPEWLRPLPAFPIDAFDVRWPGTDLVLQVCADDPMAAAHAVRVLTKNVCSMAALTWVQRGFRGTRPAGVTMRNLMGQVDGTVQPAPIDHDALVWDDGAAQPWLKGGTSLVLRRIRMEMDTWDEVDTPLRNLVLGREQTSGAPLTGSAERDAPDFTATDANGIIVIPPASHIARAHRRTDREQFLRRAYNYDDPPPPGETSDTGLLFATYQQDVDAQFLPVQQRLAEQDALNEWTTPVGSAVYVILPGAQPGGYLGQSLLED
ncbi:Dyp-type peroxidase [Tomitella biformata]|uniref:Dyp-type peroxidase n=1 Tax=Tomitella biformata TaxID=630403 RepID=UPI0004BBA10B|nr:Dyp-type peroxidase [Tomitella biformata]